MPHTRIGNGDGLCVFYWVNGLFTREKLQFDPTVMIYLNVHYIHDVIVRHEAFKLL